MVAHSGEEQVRSSLSFEEAVELIENKYGGRFHSDSPLDIWDQLLIYESLYESTPVRDRSEENVSVSVNGSDNGGCKYGVKFDITDTKKQIVEQLGICKSTTSPFDISVFLKSFFEEWPSKSGHWLYVAQQWNPREIVRVLKQMIKTHEQGFTTIQNPPAYFMESLKYRAKRKSVRRKSENSQPRSFSYEKYSDKSLLS